MWIKVDGYTKQAIGVAETTFALVTNSLGSLSNRPSEGFQSLYCYNDRGELMGSLQDFKYWYKHDIVCFEGCPRGVLYARNLNKYLGFSHRAVNAFGVGDMLFDEHWTPTKNQLKLEWIQDYHVSNGISPIPKTLDEVRLEIPELDIISYIPFNQRGFRRIESREDAIKAARNFSLYVS